MSLRGSVDARGHHLLGRHVRRRADHRLRAGELAELGRRLRDAEVENLEQVRAVGAARDEEVRRLDVAMDDAHRVRLGHALARLQDQIDDGLRHLRAVMAKDLVEVVALEDTPSP